MKSARCLVVALLLPLLTACIAAVPTSVTNSPPVAPTAKNYGPKKTFRITGYVLDAVSNKPVAEAVVRFYGVGLYTIILGSTIPRTDADGHFVLHLPVSNLDKGGYLEVQTMLYEGRTPLSADTTQPIKLLLRRNAYRFKPSGCQQLADTARIPPYVTMPIQGYPDTQYAFLFCDSLLRQSQKLRTITFKVGGYNRILSEYARLRIYRYNNHLDAPPGDDILLEHFFMFPSKEGIFTYDVSAYDIIVSGTGFFLAIEYYIGDMHGGYREPIFSYTPTGSILRPPCARADIRTWEYVIGQGWHRATAAENCWPLYESAISVEVEPAPAKH